MNSLLCGLLCKWQMPGSEVRLENGRFEVFWILFGLASYGPGKVCRYFAYVMGHPSSVVSKPNHVITGYVPSRRMYKTVEVLACAKECFLLY